MKLIELLTGGKPSAEAGREAENRRGLRRRPDHGGQEQQRPVRRLERWARPRSSPPCARRPTIAKVVAIVLRIDSPGGSAMASDLIWRETVRIKKPVIASMGDVAGSGGYYIAMGAEKIFAAPGTLTGSIGVIGGKLVTRGLYDKLGLNTEVISRGANSGTFSSNQPFTPGERKVWMELLQDTYHQFVCKAAEGRKMPYDKLEELAQGRVYTGRTAKKLGLVDELGTLARRHRRRQDGRRAEGRRRRRTARPARAQIVLRAASSAIRPPATWTRCCPRAPGFSHRRPCFDTCCRNAC